MNILQALRNTPKGRLSYDGLWYKEGALGEVLSECTSPPSIPAPPEPRTAGTTPDRSLPVTGLSLTDAEETQYRKKLSQLEDNREQEQRAREDQHNDSYSPSLKEEKDRLNRSQHDELLVPCDDELLRPRVTVSRHDDLLIPKVTEVDHALKEYEENMQKTVRRSLDERRQLFERASATFGLQAESALGDLYGRKDKEAQRQLAAALAEQRARSAEQLRYEQQCRERNKEHARLMDTRLREAQARKKQQEEEEENIRRQEMIDQLETLSKIQQEMKTMATNSVRTITACKSPQYMSENTKKASQILAQIIQRLETLKQAHAASPSAQHIQDALELTKKAKGCHDIIERGVEAANKQGKAEAEAAAKAKAATDAAAQAATAAAAGSATIGGAGSTVSAKSDEMLCVDERTFLRYQKLQEQLKALQDSYGPLTADPNMKKYKFDLQKAVNTPVNAIAPTSGKHLQDKLQRLVTVLQGGQVEVGGKRVSANDHPAGRAFVRDLFTRKIIKQGEEQVASNHESAFAIAAVTVGVWCEVPEVGGALLAHLHQRCPYTVPYYLPKKEGQSSDDYYKSLGYIFIDGTVEAQDKFLKRMSGIMRLYASVLVATPPRGSSQPHPHGIEHAWHWLANTMNLHPRPDITATMTFDLLEVAGHALFAAYRGQFVKLLQLLCTEFLPKIKQVTPAGSGGPVVRLENFLQKCIASSSVAKPPGMLSSNFWYT